MSTFLVVVGFVIFLMILNKWDRAKYPKKWADFDAKEAAKEAMKYAKRREEALATQAKEDAEAMKRIPPSQWMIMSREEKSAALKKREDAISRGF